MFEIKSEEHDATPRADVLTLVLAVTAVAVLSGAVTFTSTFKSIDAGGGELRGKEGRRARHLERRLAACGRRGVAGARVERARHAGRRDLSHRAEGGVGRAETARPWFEKAKRRRRRRRPAGERRHAAVVFVRHLGEHQLRHALGLLRLRVDRLCTSLAACRRRRRSWSRPRSSTCRATNWSGRR